jgi:predicted metal-binding protein
MDSDGCGNPSAGLRRLAFQDADPAHDDFQYLEDLSTAYWYSEVLFVAMELGIFDLLNGEDRDLHCLAQEAGCEPDALARLMQVLMRLEIVGQEGNRWFNNQAASRYLTTDSPRYLGDFLFYRRYMQSGWKDLLQRLAPARQSSPAALAPSAPYEVRNFHYVRALDALLKEKAREIALRLAPIPWQPPILDIGGGAGALCRRIIHNTPSGQAHLLELPEVLSVAREIYPLDSDWQRIRPVAGDFRTCEIEPGQQYGLILMSNFLHAYGAAQARRLLDKARAHLKPDGWIVVHDYFPDRIGRSPHKGVLYDLSMMINTYDGACHAGQEVAQWLRQAGMDTVSIQDLSTDSSLILAGPSGPEGVSQAESGELDAVNHKWLYVAREMGFRNAVVIPVDQVTIAPWVPLKCRYGCSTYGRNRQCPPHAMQPDKVRDLLKSYEHALLVEGTPPGRRFHDQLIGLERKAFLAGCHKAFALGAGPCPVCETCPEDGTCRQPEEARPSMEALGIDVYETARRSGIGLKPLPKKGRYVKYIGLVLLS